MDIIISQFYPLPIITSCFPYIHLNTLSCIWSPNLPTICHCTVCISTFFLPFHSVTDKMISNGTDLILCTLASNKYTLGCNMLLSTILPYWSTGGALQYPYSNGCQHQGHKRIICFDKVQHQHRRRNSEKTQWQFVTLCINFLKVWYALNWQP